jgi:hypothetical protein
MIQEFWPKAWATQFESVRNSIVGKLPSLNWATASNIIDLDVANQARFYDSII